MTQDCEIARFADERKINLQRRPFGKYTDKIFALSRCRYGVNLKYIHTLLLHIYIHTIIIIYDTALLHKNHARKNGQGKVINEEGEEVRYLLRVLFSALTWNRRVIPLRNYACAMQILRVYSHGGSFLRPPIIVAARNDNRERHLIRPVAGRIFSFYLFVFSLLLVAAAMLRDGPGFLAHPRRTWPSTKYTSTNKKAIS